ncbi:hypothetical protein AB4Z45_15680 [Paenibacillus sp. MCAF9]|uniref:hypothetical protein n=1 Tax=Paenibacillus sp. MCAF9 TaxID=3233046 RepID=UPI003F9B11AF
MIRMKVKTMAMLLAFLMIAAGVCYFLIPFFLFHTEKYDVLWKWFPRTESAESALLLASEASELVTDSSGDDRIFIFPSSSSSSGGERTAEERMREINRLEHLVEQYSTSSYIYGVKFNLGKLYMWNKEWDKAERLFAELEANVNAGTFHADEELRTYQAILSTRTAIPDKQAAITGKVKIGEKPAANVFVILHRKDASGWSTPPYLHYPVAITDEHGVYRFYDVDANKYEVGVGVTPAEVNGYYLTQSDREYVSALEGKTETYDFQFVPQVSVISPVNKEQLTGDKLQFEWNAYPGADYYTLSITSIFRIKDGNTVGANTVQLSDERFKGTTAEYSLKELRGNTLGFGKSMDSGGNVALSNIGVLGAVYPGGDFIWSVDAYDAGGRKISSSSGYYTSLVQKTPFFTMPEEGMLAGDRLVIKGEYEEAIASYKSEGDNDDALRPLARLIYYGITKADGDPAEALTYLERVRVPNASDKDLMKQMKEKLEGE